jgi:ribonuclease Z
MHPPALADVIPFHDKDKAIPPSTSPVALTEKQFSAASPELKTVLKEAHSAVAAVRNAKKYRSNAGSISGGDIVVTTLGTGSAIPSKYRNVSATLLHIPKMVNGETGVILLDSGEGTLGQMRRRFGPTKMRELYADLKMIFISHMHADHHLGLHSILEDRFKVSIPIYAAVVGLNW